MGFRYIGSKEKLSDIIISEIRRINDKATHVIDLMAGTGQFSLALRENNYQVTAVDVMTYSFHHLNVHLKVPKNPLFERVEQIKGIDEQQSFSLFGESNYELILSHLNNLKPLQGYFWKEFCPEGIPTDSDRPRKYFTPNNASKIDAIRLEIKNLYAKKLITDIEHSLLLHDLIMAVNDIANIAGTYGHYLSKFVKRSESPIKLAPFSFSNKGNFEGHQIIRGYAEDVSKMLKADICYIDPPYIKRQYAANYHILETIAREDEPDAVGESGLRPWRDQYSNFCSKVKIRDSFTKIIEGIETSDFLISYSEDGLLPIQDLIDFLSNYGQVSKKSIKYKRFKSNDSLKDSMLDEYLIHLTKN